MQLNGYQNHSGSYELSITYNCDYNISITSLSPLTTQTPETSTAIATNSDVLNTCTDYPCPFAIISIDQNVLNVSIFNFNISDVDNILMRVNWDQEYFDLYNHRTKEIRNYLLLRRSIGSVVNNDNMDGTEIEPNDMLSFVDIDVFIMLQGSVGVWCSNEERKQWRPLLEC